MITLNVFFRVKPEHREQLLEVVRTLFEALVKEPTFVEAWINAAVDQPDLVVVYEGNNILGALQGHWLNLPSAKRISNSLTDSMLPAIAIISPFLAPLRNSYLSFGMAAETSPSGCSFTLKMINKSDFLTAIDASGSDQFTGVPTKPSATESLWYGNACAT